MKSTYNLNGIILSRLTYKESDSKIAVYTLEKGKINLIVRGTTKLNSKLSGHIEPFSLCSIMGVRGKNLDYAGAVLCDNAYAEIKKNYFKTILTGKVISFFEKEIKEEEKDKNIFLFLYNFLESLNYFNFKKDILEKNLNLFYYFFIFKLLVELGYSPDFSSNFNPKSNFSFFDFKNSSLIPEAQKNKNSYLKISNNLINLLKLVKKSDFNKLFSFRIEENLKKESEKMIFLFYKYNFF